MQIYAIFLKIKSFHLFGHQQIDAVQEGVQMKKKSIFRQLLIPMIVLAAALPAVVLMIFTTSYEQEIYSKNKELSSLMGEEISIFMDGAYHINEGLADNPSILTMETDVQTPILAQCVERNSYLDQIYIQGTDGMQTGRSSGELADRSSRWWFIQMMEEPEAFISKSYYSVATGMPCASVFFPMYKDGTLTGIYAADLKLDFLQDLTGKYSNEEDGRISFVIDGEGVVVAHPDQTQIEEQYNYKDQTRTVSVKDSAGNPATDKDGNIITEQHPLDISPDLEQIITQVMAGGSDSRKISYNGQTYYASYTSIPLQGNSDSWSLITLQERSDAMSMVSRMLIASAVISLAAVTAVVLIIMYLARKLTMPVASITGLMKDAADGDFSIHAEESRQDEVGQLARSYNIMAGKISGALLRIMDFTQDLLKCSNRLQAVESEIGTISRAVKEISDGTSEQALEVDNVVERMASLEERFGELKKQSGTLLNGAGHTMQSGEEGLNNMKELEKQNRHVENNINSSYEKIKLLQIHSEKIGEIVDTINNISSETELLALNANIEAARAGEHGRGFAVVAESIGKLAANSSKATADIADIVVEFCGDIDSIVSQMEDVKEITLAQIQSVQRIGDIFLDFEKMSGQTSSTAGSMDSLIDEMYEIDQSIVNAAQHISAISKNAEHLSGEAAASLEEELRDIQSGVKSLTMVSGEMEQEMKKFKLHRS